MGSSSGGVGTGSGSGGTNRGWGSGTCWPSAARRKAWVAWMVQASRLQAAGIASRLWRAVWTRRRLERAAFAVRIMRLAWAWHFMAGMGSLKSWRAWRMFSLAWASAMTTRREMAHSSALAGT